MFETSDDIDSGVIADAWTDTQIANYNATGDPNNSGFFSGIGNAFANLKIPNLWSQPQNVHQPLSDHWPYYALAVGIVLVIVVVAAKK